MTHEHLYIDFSFMYRPPQDSALDLADDPITLENVGWVRYNYYSNRANLQLMDLDAAVAEVALYKAAGGGAIVDATTIGIGRNAKALERISKETGVHVVMGAGFYVDAVHPHDMHLRNVDVVAQRIVDDIRNGVDGTGIKAGIIGEVGCTWPLTDNERMSLRAAAAAQQETGASVLIHPGRHPDAPAGDSGGAGRRRSGHITGDYGASGQDGIRPEQPADHSIFRLLPRMGPVRERGIILSAGGPGYAERRAAA